MSDKYLEFAFERYEEYWGSSDNVKKIISECHECGSKLIFTHLPDYKNLIIQETGRCTDCGEGSRKKIHIIN